MRLLKNGNALLIPMLIIGILYFIIGFGVGISGFLTPFLKDALHLTVTQSYLVPVAVFSAFVIFGAPAGWVVSKAGYKRSIAWSLFIMSLGMILFVPSANMGSFPTFLLALFIVGIGKTLLQVSVNPYITIIGPQEGTVMRMCLMGILNKLAWWLCPVFLGLFLNLNNVKLEQVSLPFYIVTGILIVLGIFTYYSPLPEVQAPGENESNTSDTNGYTAGKTRIFQIPHLFLGVLALFFYIGVEVLPMASIIDFAKVVYGEGVTNLEGYAKYVPIGMFIGYVFGVFMIPKLISHTRALRIFSIIGFVASLSVILLPGKIAIYCLAAIGFANSIMWGAIWQLALADLGKFTKKGASFLVMSLVGAAVFPFIFGYVIDIFKTTEIPVVSDYQNAYWIFIPAYLFILYYGTFGYKIRRNAILNNL
jgi:MFS transporter, FHS family, L-fucose permease